jgi:hypothetical protein
MSTKSTSQRLLAIAEELRAIAEKLRAEQQESEFPADREPLFEAKICLWCEQSTDKPIARRGLHDACYHALMRAIREGKTTDSEAVRTGRVKPAQAATGRKKSKTHEESLARLGQAAVAAQAKIAASDPKPPASPPLGGP